MIYNFIWKKRDRIKKHALIGSIEQGEIGTFDKGSKFKAETDSWISKISDKGSMIHISITRLYFKIITQVLKKCDITVSDVKNKYFLKNSKFHKEAIAHRRGPITPNAHMVHIVN